MRLTPRVWAGWLALSIATFAAIGAALLWSAVPTSPPEEQATAASPAPAAPEAPPLPSDISVGEWLAGHSQDWRVGWLRENPAVLVIEFPSLAEQGAAMNRIAALLEKADAPRDRVLDDLQLALLIARSGDSPPSFFLGHDVDDAGLARFYAAVDSQAQPLNPQETRLRRLLAEHGMPGLAAAPASAPQRALISFTATQADDPSTPADEAIDPLRRASVLRHEISHGRFFTRPAYRAHCERFWREELSEAQRTLFRRFLERLGYDRNDELLMLNETQAFLLHTPDARVFSGALVGLTEDALEALRERFWSTLPPDAQQR
jgi:hypothetical protein